MQYMGLSMSKDVNINISLLPENTVCKCHAVNLETKLACTHILYCTSSLWRFCTLLIYAVQCVQSTGCNAQNTLALQ